MNAQCWQAVGTWVAGIALAIFAFLTWRLSSKQDSRLHNPMLTVYQLSSYPTLSSNYRDGAWRFSAHWQLGVYNPGTVPVLIKGMRVSVKGTDTNQVRSFPYAPSAGFSVFIKGGYDYDVMKGFQLDFRLEPSPHAPLEIEVMLHGDGYSEALKEVLGEKRGLKLELSLSYQAMGREKPKATSPITSEEMFLSDEDAERLQNPERQ